MRSAERIGRTADAYAEYQRRERERNLRAFLAACREARAAGEEWVRWLDAGKPRYSDAEYDAVEAGKTKPRPARRAAPRAP
jgi:hypothetical protein